MTRLCGWCGKHLGDTGDGRPEVVTHGICAPCKELHFDRHLELLRARRLAAAQGKEAHP